MPNLFHPVALGAVELPNRVLMAPMTRCRTEQPGGVPNEMMARYYAQRASAGLIITEVAQVSPQGQGASFSPGIHSKAQVAGWRRVTDAVHAVGGRIFLQLGHAGRMSHESLQPDGRTVAPSAIAPREQTWLVDPATGEAGMVQCPTPRALATREIESIVEDFRQAAENAFEARFDGVEIHAANGHLIDQFLRRPSNWRTDPYGGSKINRVRFLSEVAEAVSDVFSPGRTGVRLSPFLMQRGMADEEILQTTLVAAEELEKIGVAYIHLAEADIAAAQRTPGTFRIRLRRAFNGGIVVAGNYNLQRAQGIIWDGYADAVAFGRPFIANPDLPRRFEEGLPLARFDPSTLIGGGEDGYSTYQSLDEYAMA